MNRGLSLIVAFASLILVAGCTVSVGDGGGDANPFPGAQEVGVNTEPNTAVVSGTLAPDEDVLYEALLDSSELERQAVYFELNTALDLYVYASTGDLYGTSSSGAFFAAGTAGLQSMTVPSDGIRPAIVSPQTCRGSCIIHDANSQRFFVGIVNRSGTSQSYSLYAYAGAYQDSGEFENDTTTGAVALGDGDEGAIEHIGDTDYYDVTQGGNLIFDTSATVNVTATIIDGNTGRRIKMTPAEPIEVFTNDLIEVTVPGGDEAAVASNSLYFLSYQQ
jgi:hypothetical protein